MNVGSFLWFSSGTSKFLRDNACTSASSRNYLQYDTDHD